ncbi:MAG: hypothetical protein RMM30_11210 [Armatimonadota bacterium]|nr:hypothetical protein [Armatimonadota bacterium]MDW8157139.1 hypothetical protein [Armatimonadota bacterium]
MKTLVVRFWLAFALAVVGFHGAWQGARLAWADPEPARWAVVAAWLAVLAGAVAWAGYLLYAADRQAGRVRRPVRAYDRWLAAQRGGRRP